MLLCGVEGSYLARRPQHHQLGCVGERVLGEGVEVQAALALGYRGELDLEEGEGARGRVPASDTWVRGQDASSGSRPRVQG